MLNVKYYMTEIGIGLAGLANLAGPIVACAFLDELHYAVAWADVDYIDKTNALAASLHAARKALHALGSTSAQKIIIEGLFSLDKTTVPCRSLLGQSPYSHPLVGKAKQKAEEWLQDQMQQYHQLYPEWKFDLHAGAPTEAHKALLRAKKQGTPVHRKTFAPLSRYLFTASQTLDQGKLKRSGRPRLKRVN